MILLRLQSKLLTILLRCRTFLLLFKWLLLSLQRSACLLDIHLKELVQIATYSDTSCCRVIDGVCRPLHFHSALFPQWLDHRSPKPQSVFILWLLKPYVMYVSYIWVLCIPSHFDMGCHMSQKPTLNVETHIHQSRYHIRTLISM